MEPSTALQNPPTPPGQKRAQGRQGAVRLCREPADGCRRACTGARRMRAGRRGCRLGRLHGSLPLVRRPEGKCGGKGKGDGAGPRPREAEPFARAREAGGRRAGARPREVEPVAPDSTPTAFCWSAPLKLKCAQYARTGSRRPPRSTSSAPSPIASITVTEGSRPSRSWSAYLRRRGGPPARPLLAPTLPYPIQQSLTPAPRRTPHAAL